PALLPPACCEVRPGKIPTALSPKLWKIFVIAWPKPFPYASNNTTVAIPHAIPSMVRTVLRRSWRMAPKACCRRSRCMLFLAERVDRLQHGGAARRIKSRCYSCNRQRRNGQDRRHRHEFGRIESRWRWKTRKHRHQPGSEPHPNSSTQQCQERSFHKKLEHDATVGGANRLT